MQDVEFDLWNSTKKSIEAEKVTRLLFPRESEVWMCAFGKNIGFEQNGAGERFSRPTLVIKKFNNQMLLAVPLSTKQKNLDFYHNFVDLRGDQVSAILAQIKLMSVKRFRRKLYRLPSLEFEAITGKLAMMIVPIKSKPRDERGISEPEGALCYHSSVNIMKKSTEIIPAILPMDFAELEDKLALIHGFVKTVQIDACDGQFVQNATWPYRKHDDSFDKMVKEEIGMPGWEDTNFEVDLMANRPEERVEEWISAGASRIVIHAEAKGDIDAAIAKLTDKVEIGLALNEDTPVETISKYHERIQFVQLMGIDQIGFQHQPFDEKVIGRVREVRLKYPGLPIAVDGGVSFENAAELIDAGADRLVIGSAIFNAENPMDAVEKFKSLT